MASNELPLDASPFLLGSKITRACPLGIVPAQLASVAVLLVCNQGLPIADRSTRIDPGVGFRDSRFQLSESRHFSVFVPASRSGVSQGLLRLGA